MSAIASSLNMNSVASKPSPSDANLLRTWMWSEGVGKSSTMTVRSTAREAKSLMSNWVVSEGICKEGVHQSARVLQSAGARSPKALMSEWMWSNGVARMPFVQVGRGSPSSPTLASRWLIRDGAARLPSWIQADEMSARQGAARSSLAMSWLTTGVVPKMGPIASKVAMPLTAMVAIAGASYCAAEVLAKGKRNAGLLVRRSSVEAPARLALKYI
uniref:Uncharacterized protein n=1 Tax=Cryptomonas curvata TaxID=233186 RepID=A0A7S0N4U4_9CRYP|mmetsp:Transcript_658/g.1391  ORF Transcript_658/g.1391 Transcript_658/m.1391 type:complete len:215 (+) Transcript_658:126-770(+)